MSVPTGPSGTETGLDGGAVPAAFAIAAESLRTAVPRPEVRLSEVRPPQRLAPYALALSGSVPVAQPGTGPEDEVDDLATGRLVVLHDPEGHESWHGCTRLVAYVRADLDPEMAGDPMLASVGWSWLLEALSSHGAQVTAAGGTVTRASSESFGALAEARPTAELEVRASWSPLEDDLSAHLAGWCDLLCYAAGLPPAVPGVASLTGARALRA